MKKILLPILLSFLCLVSLIAFYINNRINFSKNITNHFDYFDVADEEPKQIDVIFSFAGDTPLREKKAFSLYNKHKNATWIMSSNYPVSQLENILNQNLDTSRILRIKNSKNTFEEVLNLRHFLDDNRKKNTLPSNKKETSIALVSNGWHLKRIQMIAKWTLKGNNVSLIRAEKDKTPASNIGFYKEEYRDILFDWWRCFIWKTSFGNIKVKPPSKKNNS